MQGEDDTILPGLGENLTGSLVNVLFRRAFHRLSTVVRPVSMGQFVSIHKKANNG
jgi:hypothetical protein